MTEVRIRVAVRLRPLLPRERLHAHRECLRVVPGAPQVILGSDQVFSFDHAFGPSASQDEVYDSCVRPLTRCLLDGTNATVFCYGQTGSGKTYTLGGNKMDAEGGIISCLAKDVFSLLDKQRSEGVEIAVRVSYLELYKEELRDLLELDTSRKELQIRDDFRGNTVVVGAKEVAVSSCDELLNVLEMGNALRQTGATRMNEHSSRSHTVLTLWLRQSASAGSDRPERFSKFCVVDLAGSERVGKTGNTGVRFEESVHINTDLLALGNVIRALAQPGRQRSSYIPYRHAKITRLLRDSLGGNACTLMVACVSPSHHSFAESLSVLRFASKSRRIYHHTELATPEPDCDEALTTMLTSADQPKYDVQPLRPSGRDFTPHQDVIHREESTYLSLVHQAADLLSEACGTDTQNDTLTQRVHEWQERVKAISQPRCSKDIILSDKGDSPHLVTIVQLRQDLKKCQESLETEARLVAQKDAKLKQVQKEVQELLEKQNVLLKTFCEEKEQTERLVDQQILIDRLRCDLMAIRGKTLGTSCRSHPRPHIASLIRPSCGHTLISKICPGLPGESLERLMATFKVSNHRLQSQEEVKDFCPLLKQKAELQSQEKDNFVSGLGWTSRQKKSALKEKHLRPDQTSLQRIQQKTWTKRQAAEHCRMKDLRQSLTQRRIQMLSANMGLKEELVREMEKTEKEMLGAVRHDAGDQGEDKALTWLSEQTRQARLALHHSLQHMDLYRAQLQKTLRRPSPESSDNSGESELVESIPESRNNLGPKAKLCLQSCESCWLDEAVEHELQRSVTQQELDKELSKSEEVRRRRDAFLKRKNLLETERLCSSQVLSQNLLHVSVQMETLEEKQASTTELEKEREMLRKRRDHLDSQLKDSMVLTMEEEQLEEAVEVLEAELVFKQQSIQDKLEKIRSSASGRSAHLSDISGKLRTLSQAEASELLVKYFSKVVDLRQTQTSMNLYCKELEIDCAEQAEARGQLEAAVHNMALDTDRRLTQQQQEHQKNIRFLISKLKQDNSSEEAQQAIRERLQSLEKELFFYKHCNRKLRKQLKESQCLDQSLQETPLELNGSKDARRRLRQQSPSSSSSSADNAKTPAEHQISALARCHGYSERRPPAPHGTRASVGPRRRKLREPAGPAKDSVVDTGIEMLSDESLDASTGSETPDLGPV
ncbi:kinesin-like protein KIF27 isoform X2 [Corythoichthys intestinalis]|uniref:kinesin-like protein KIF27 isoform X2 n=1 Tax=Corythoichthys intestinalis TaxID=161448 RepID=UPI0025A634BB|nr:kinesin-like protein KIF27 isoform X2 [Corythoichthys intestinalis]